MRLRQKQCTIYLNRKPRFKTYGKVIIIDLIKFSLLLGLVIPCGIEWLLVGIIKKKGLNKEFWRIPLKN